MKLLILHAFKAHPQETHSLSDDETCIKRQEWWFITLYEISGSEVLDWGIYGELSNYGPFLGPYYHTGPNTGPNLGTLQASYGIVVLAIQIFSNP